MTFILKLLVISLLFTIHFIMKFYCLLSSISTPVYAHEMYILVHVYILSNTSIVLLIFTTKMHAKPIYLVRISVICHFWVNYSLSFKPKIYMLLQQRDLSDVKICNMWFIGYSEKGQKQQKWKILFFSSC